MEKKNKNNKKSQLNEQKALENPKQTSIHFSQTDISQNKTENIQGFSFTQGVKVECLFSLPMP